MESIIISEHKDYCSILYFFALFLKFMCVRQEHSSVNSHVHGTPHRWVVATTVHSKTQRCLLRRAIIQLLYKSKLTC